MRNKTTIFTNHREIFTDVGNDGVSENGRKSEIIIIRQNIIFSKDFRHTKYFICDTTLFLKISGSRCCCCYCCSIFGLLVCQQKGNLNVKNHNKVEIFYSIPYSS
jgi:hypothetical protein